MQIGSRDFNRLKRSNVLDSFELNWNPFYLNAKILSTNGQCETIAQPD